MVRDGQVTLADVCNAFRSAQDKRVATRELSQRMYNAYATCCDVLPESVTAFS